jgi:L-glutamine:2-deoxy-scyllo-inosose/3-amino-2,3-dideoxy-scyllo-inosose aminotransferase
MLAIQGGPPLRDTDKHPWPRWPAWGDTERRAVNEALDSGVWSYNGPWEQRFNADWKTYSGSPYALLVANGTIALQLALEALDIGWGDEVIVPGLTWQATAAAVLDVNAVPVLVDVDPGTWCLSAAAVEAAVSERTRAIIPVHLYGGIADMDAILAIAGKYNLKVIEDCSHQHGGIYKGRQVGTLGDIGCFSLQLSKVLTGGEGGILTCRDHELWVRLDALRNCGRVPRESRSPEDRGDGVYEAEGNLIQSGNYRISEFQAAVLTAQLKRLPAQNRRRDENARYLSKRLAALPGITPQKRGGSVGTLACYNYAFAYDASAFAGLPVQLFRQALQAELGCTVAPSYQPLNDCSLYRPLTKKRYRIDPSHEQAIDPSRFELPVCEDIYRRRSVTVHHAVLLAGREDMDQIAAAVAKIQAGAGKLAEAGA